MIWRRHPASDHEPVLTRLSEDTTLPAPLREGLRHASRPEGLPEATRLHVLRKVRSESRAPRAMPYKRFTVAVLLAAGSATGAAGVQRLLESRRETAPPARATSGRATSATPSASPAARSTQRRPEPSPVRAVSTALPAADAAPPASSPDAHTQGQSHRLAVTQASTGARIDAKRDTSGGLHAELKALERARAAAPDDAEHALHLIRQYRAQHANRQLELEAQILEIESLVRLGRVPAARSLAARVLAGSPGALYTQRIEAALTLAPRPSTP